MKSKALVPMYLWQYLENDKNILKFILIKLIRKLNKQTVILLSPFYILNIL